MAPEEKLQELGLVLPDLPERIANYLLFKPSGKLVWISGQGPRLQDGSFVTGKVGLDYSLEEAYEHARLVGLDLLAVARAAAGGNLDRVEFVKLLGMVNATPAFHDHPKVINGCSELFAEIWGAVNGVGARSAVGMASLPHDIAVEIEGIFELTQ